MDTTRMMCKICGETISNYGKHIIDEHADLVTPICRDMRKRFGISKALSLKVRNKLGRVNRRISACPRCGEVVHKKKEHLETKHAAELLIAKKNGLLLREIRSMLFNNWCSKSIISQAMKYLEEDLVTHYPISVVYMCQGKDGLRMMEQGECGIGIAMSL